MPLCGNCGREVVDGAESCQNCGKRTGSNTSSETGHTNDGPLLVEFLRLFSAAIMGLGSLMFRNLFLITRMGSCYFSMTFFWISLLSLAGGLSALIGRLYPLALLAAVSIFLVGVTLLIAYPHSYVNQFFFTCTLLGFLAIVFLVALKSNYSFKAGTSSKDGKKPSGRILGNRIIRRTLAITVVTLLIALVLLSYLDCRYANPRHGYYEVVVNIAPDVDFEMIVPIPVNESLEPWDLVHSLGVKNGNASWQIVETSRGFGLRITGRGNVTLRCEDALEAHPYFALSPQNRSVDDWQWDHPPFFVYVNASGLEDLLSLNVSASYSSTWMKIWTLLNCESGDLTTGWQVIEGRHDEKHV